MWIKEREIERDLNSFDKKERKKIKVGIRKLVGL